MAKKLFKIRSGLTEALEDTISSAKNNAGELHVEIISLKRLLLDPDNPRDFALSFEDLYEGISQGDPQQARKVKEKESLQSLSKSVGEQGVINPITVYKELGQYKLIAGERRTLASILAKKEDIPARILTSKPNPLKHGLLQWIENIEREDLSLWERLCNLEKILSAYADNKESSLEKVTATELSKLLGCSLSQSTHYKAIVGAQATLKEEIHKGNINNIEKAAFIAKSPTATQEALIKACCDGKTLSELKKVLHDCTEAKPIVKKGRPKSIKINLGTTKRVDVAEAIIKSILNNQQFAHLKPKIKDINWESNASISAAFRSLILLLEKNKHEVN